MSLKIIKTNDGSSSLYNEELDETYHSIHGSLQEALHVFIQMGLVPALGVNTNLQILEIGFGTGLNSYLTAMYFKENSEVKASYCGIDTTPLSEDLMSDLDYSQQDRNLFTKIHSIPWEVESPILENFTLLKREVDLMKANFEKDHFHLIYFDAFGPRAQGDMWTIENFKKLYDCLVHGGVLVTYCAKGQVRRDMESVGFTMERLKGPPGKREMLRATK